MAQPSRKASQRFIRKVCSRPAFWGLLGGAGLFVVAGYQYLQQPNVQLNAAHSPAGEDLGNIESVTPDVADASESENLLPLLNRLQPTTASVTNSPPSLQELAESQGDALSLPTPEVAPFLLEDQPGAGSHRPGSPFADYLTRTQFPGRNAPAGLYQQVRDGSGATAGIAPTAALTDVAPTAKLGQPQPQLSPLERALLQQQSGGGPVSGAETATTMRDAIAAPEYSANPATVDPLPLPWAVNNPAPGIGQRFIRTLPQMSPPPGTTGYRLPPGLELPPAASPAWPNAPGYGPTVDFGEGSGWPGAARVDAGAVAPVLPQVEQPGAGYRQPQPLPEVQPFTVPRPPGSYTGGGYINTFSDPAGPVP